jgi:hypothetical protein
LKQGSLFLQTCGQNFDLRESGLKVDPLLREGSRLFRDGCFEPCIALL